MFEVKDMTLDSIVDGSSYWTNANANVTIVQDGEEFIRSVNIIRTGEGLVYIGYHEPSKSIGSSTTPPNSPWVVVGIVSNSNKVMHQTFIANSVLPKNDSGSGDSEFSKPPHHCTPDPRFDGKMNNYRYPGVPPKGREGIE